MDQEVWRKMSSTERAAHMKKQGRANKRGLVPRTPPKPKRLTRVDVALRTPKIKRTAEQKKLIRDRKRERKNKVWDYDAPNYNDVMRRRLPGSFESNSG